MVLPIKSFLYTYKMARYRRWCFTINHPTEDDVKAVDDIECRYIVCGVEVGENGTEHLQGYVEFERAVRLNTVRTELGGRAHLEQAHGTAEQNRAYCTKDGRAMERGTPANPGNRTDIHAIKELVANGGRMAAICAQATSYQAMRMGEMLLRFVGPERKEAPEVFWYWGASGTGKTRTAVEEAGADYWMSSKGLQWWDGYDGHPHVIIDDFRADFCKFHELLRILDRYPYRVEVKGGSRMLLATKIWITAPVPPERAYARSDEETAQLTRRIKLCREFN